MAKEGVALPRTYVQQKRGHNKQRARKSKRRAIPLEEVERLMIGKLKAVVNRTKLRKLRPIGNGEGAVLSLERQMLEGLPFATTSRGCFVSIFHIGALYFQLLQRDNCVPPGTYPVNLNLFCDASEMYGSSTTRKCHLLSMSLAGAYFPHEKLLNITLGRWIGADDRNTYASAIATVDLVAF